MQYFVIWNDGQKFGPADIDTLNEWIAQGRVTAATELESVVDGTRLQAGSVPGLNFSGAAAPVDSGASLEAEAVATASAEAAGSAQYFVIGADGSKYGPADVATLTQWAADNRLSPNSELEDASNGVRTTASLVPGLMFPTAAAAEHNPISPNQPQSAGGSASMASNYPRAGMGHGPSAEDLRKFNWGAFLLHWIWAFNHKYKLAWVGLVLWLLSFIPMIGMVFSLGLLGWGVYQGINGNQIAWDSGRFSSVDEMHKCEVIWAKWGLGLIIVGCVCGIGLGILMAMGQIASGGAGFGR